MPPWAPPGAPAPAMPGPSRLQAGQVGQHPLGLRLLVVAFEAERPDGPIQLRLGLPSLLDGVLPDRELEEVELADGPTLHDHIRDLPDPDLLPTRRSYGWEQGERVQVERHPGTVGQEPQLGSAEQPTHRLLPRPHGGDPP